jgi:hypothetical protein
MSIGTTEQSAVAIAVYAARELQYNQYGHGTHRVVRRRIWVCVNGSCVWLGYMLEQRICDFYRETAITSDNAHQYCSLAVALSRSESQKVKDEKKKQKTW